MVRMNAANAIMGGTAVTPSKGYASILVPEVLVHIVRQPTHPQEADLNTYVGRLNKFASVCRHWRDVVLGTPLLWTAIEATDEPCFPWNAASLLMARASELCAPIEMKVSVQNNRKADQQKLVEALAAHQSVFKGINVACAYRPLTPEKVTLSFPAITSLKLNLSGPRSRCLRLDLSDSPDLAELELRSPLQLHIGFMQFEHLTTVSFIGNGFRVVNSDKASEAFIASCFDVVRAAPRLQSLRISQIWTKKSTGEEFLPSIDRLQLSHLRSLSLTYLRPNVVSRLLRCLRCPQLTEAQVAPYSKALSGDCVHGADAFFFEAKESLESLQVENMNLNELRTSLIRCTRLRSLSVVGEDYEPGSVQSLATALAGRGGQSEGRCLGLGSLYFNGLDIITTGMTPLIKVRSLAGLSVCFCITF